MDKIKHLALTLDKSQERGYIKVPFQVEKNTERIDIRYRYPSSPVSSEGDYCISGEPCTIDLAVMLPDGTMAGASGSDRSHVWLSPLGSSAGFLSGELPEGTWHIIAGAYHVPAEGVTVEYTLEFTEKKRRLFKGDTHVHTTASDGILTPEEAAGLAKRMGLDYLFFTDHNNSAQNENLPDCDDITLLPGTEWTHYKGHAGFLGVKRAFLRPYFTGSPEETDALFREAGERGAFRIINHPFCPLVPWEWGFALPFDGLEVWNGVMSERNERAAGWWHAQLCAGRRIPVTGGSDYHRPGLLGSLAMPCHCLYAPSRSPQDLLQALRRGNGFISYLPSGPMADLQAEGMDGNAASFGDFAVRGCEVSLLFTGLQAGDEIRLITEKDTEILNAPKGAVQLMLKRNYPDALFLRLELYRSYAPSLPPMKALLSNPVYFG